jgi:hypothetical protein
MGERVHAINVQGLLLGNSKEKEQERETCCVRQSHPVASLYCSSEGTKHIIAAA